MIERVRMGEGSVIVGDRNLVNLYDCLIGDRCAIAPFVEIQNGVRIGDDCKISSHTFICAGVTLGNRVWIGHGVMFTNDLYPNVVPCENYERPTVIEDDVAIGTGAVILPIRIGAGSIVGAGAICVKEVPPLSFVAGNPAKVIRQFGTMEERDVYIQHHNSQRVPG